MSDLSKKNRLRFAVEATVRLAKFVKVDLQDLLFMVEQAWERI